MTSNSRLVVLIISALAWAALAVQTAVDLSAGDGLATSLWTQLRYFTNTTVLAVALLFGWAAIQGRWPHPGWPAAITVWIVLVGVVYHALLAATHHPEGWDVLVNIVQHTILPVAVLIAWLTVFPQHGLAVRHAIYWVAYPLGYATYAIVRGLIDGKFPYFFLDPVKTGVPGVIGFIIGLGALFFISGLLIVWVARKNYSQNTANLQP